MPGSKPIAILVSRDTNYAAALAVALATDFEVQLVSAEGHQPLSEVIERSKPSILIHDTGAQLELGPSLVVVRSVPTLILGPDNSQAMIQAVEAGALGYLSRESTFGDIKQGIATVAEGTAVIPPFMLGSLLHHVVERRRGETAALEQLEGLTPREREVFEMAASGLGHKGVAERLFMSPATARTHLHRIFKKLDIHSKAELVALAASCGISTSEES